MNAGLVVVCSLSGVGICLAMVLILRHRLASYPRGSGDFKKKMEDLSDVIARGARSFLITEVSEVLVYKALPHHVDHRSLRQHYLFIYSSGYFVRFLTFYTVHLPRHLFDHRECDFGSFIHPLQ